MLKSMSIYTERFQGIIETYIEELDKAEKNRKPGSGLFGIGHGPGDYPCHEEMDRQVAELAEEIAEGDAAADEIAEIVKPVLQAEESRPWPEAARWAVMATQRHVLPLIARMSAADRETMLAWYEKAYPKRRRMPLQKQILEELKKI